MNNILKHLLFRDLFPKPDNNEDPVRTIMESLQLSKIDKLGDIYATVCFG
jgi:hypothetical protein